MAQFFTLRLAAPVASLAAPRIDSHGGALPIPSLSLLAGLIGAALGLRRADHARLQALQDAMRAAFVVECAGTVVVDFQTVRMGTPHMTGPMWWHDGEHLGTSERTGGDKTRGLVVERPLTWDYRATAVIELLEGRPFTAETILTALREPVFPLALGQQSCLFSEPVAGRIVEAETLEAAIARAGLSGTLYLPAEASSPRPGDLRRSLPAGRDWRSRSHGGAILFRVRTA